MQELNWIIEFGENGWLLILNLVTFIIDIDPLWYVIIVISGLSRGYIYPEAKTGFLYSNKRSPLRLLLY